jgi:hypothetical protein
MPALGQGRCGGIVAERPAAVPYRGTDKGRTGLTLRHGASRNGCTRPYVAISWAESGDLGAAGLFTGQFARSTDGKAGRAVLSAKRTRA